MEYNTNLLHPSAGISTRAAVTLFWAHLRMHPARRLQPCDIFSRYPADMQLPLSLSGP